MTYYRLEIQAANEDHSIWQVMHIEEVPDYEGTALELAEDTAQNQNIAEGEHWRVRIYLADNDSGPIAEAGPDIPNLRQRAAELVALESLPPAERAARAAALANILKTELAAIRYAAIFEVAQAESWQDAAQRFGVSVSMINRAVTQHRATMT